MTNPAPPVQLDTLVASQSKLNGWSRDFVNSVFDQFNRRGSLSPKQWAVVERIYNQVQNGGSTEQPSEDIGGAKLVAFMDRAHQHVKFPKVRLSADGEPLVLTRAGERSKTPGAIQVTDGGPFEDNVWYGRITRDGVFQSSRKCTPAVRTVLKALAEDPAATAAAYGKKTGTCCMCGRQLTDGRSIAVGYGPVCAERYQLPWGEKRVETEVVHQEREQLNELVGPGLNGVLLEPESAEDDTAELTLAREKRAPVEGEYIPLEV